MSQPHQERPTESIDVDRFADDDDQNRQADRIAEEVFGGEANVLINMENFPGIRGNQH